MKPNRLILLVIAVILVVLAATWRLYNPLAPSGVKALIDSELKEMPGAELDGGGMMMNVTYAQVMRKWESKWKDMERSVRRGAASESEAEGVLATARKHFGSGDNEFFYGVPVQTKRIWYRFRPVWIIKFRWGIGSDGGPTEPPSHIRTLGISGTKPHKLLAVSTCG